MSNPHVQLTYQNQAFLLFMIRAFLKFNDYLQPCKASQILQPLHFKQGDCIRHLKCGVKEQVYVNTSFLSRHRPFSQFSKLLGQLIFQQWCNREQILDASINQLVEENLTNPLNRVPIKNLRVRFWGGLVCTTLSNFQNFCLDPS